MNSVYGFLHDRNISRFVNDVYNRVERVVDLSLFPMPRVLARDLHLFLQPCIAQGGARDEHGKPGGKPGE
jgi:hypothetical protein